jgi:hypothetical protein|tara:strand:+ start:3707 stop:3868 length:162 start_codon:yes stop_codon:yes gene_type:complete
MLQDDINFDETIDTTAKQLEEQAYPWTEQNEVLAFIADEDEAEHDRYSNDWEG